MDSGLTVAFGHDCGMDPWYPLGSQDMLDVAHMGLHVAQMTGANQMRDCFKAITTNPAEILGLEKYGLKVGGKGDLVILQCEDEIEALRLRPQRLYVIRSGKIISRASEAVSYLDLAGQRSQTDFMFSKP